MYYMYTGDVKVVLNEGMPHHKNPYDKGRLIIDFKVYTGHYNVKCTCTIASMCMCISSFLYFG